VRETQGNQDWSLHWKGSSAVIADQEKDGGTATSRLNTAVQARCCLPGQQIRLRVCTRCVACPHLLSLIYAYNCCAPVLLLSAVDAAAHLHIVVVANQGALGETVLGLAALQVPHDHGLVTVVEKKGQHRHKTAQVESGGTVGFHAPDNRGDAEVCLGCDVWGSEPLHLLPSTEVPLLRSEQALQQLLLP
jgi:hypothetical protein